MRNIRVLVVHPPDTDGRDLTHQLKRI
ncbi:ANTAR domain-containing protein, partial [Burkholderia cepacia]|nr:ANTAR domain-containing protein [Burkholderia cepacia]